MPGRLARLFTGAPSTPAAEIRAAATLALAPTNALVTGWGSGGELLAPVEWAPPVIPLWDRSAAMSIPTISRCRDLICSTVGALPLTSFTVDWERDPPVERSLPPPTWMQRPDPNKTRQWLLSWTTDDLYFYSVAYWRIVTRGADRFPLSFERMPAIEVTVNDDGTVRWDNRWWQEASGGDAVDAADVVEFLSPIEGILSNGYRAISTALSLDTAAERFAGAEIPAGILEEQDGGEDLSAAELDQMAVNFTMQRRTNTTAATNKYVRYREVNSNPDQMQLVESRTYQALELARLGNCPPYLVGAPAGTGMTYQNALQARGDLIDFGALPYVGCIEQTLGGNNVTPRGRFVRLDTNAWLRNPLSPETDPAPNDMQTAFNTPPDAPAPAAAGSSL